MYYKPITPEDFNEKFRRNIYAVVALASCFITGIDSCDGSLDHPYTPIISLLSGFLAIKDKFSDRNNFLDSKLINHINSRDPIEPR